MYFRDTFVFMKENDYSSAAMVVAVDSRAVSLRVEDKQISVPRLSFACSLQKPEEGFYQLDEDLVFLLPTPYRGVLKGFGSHNICITPLCNWKGLFGYTLDPYTVAKLFNKQQGKGTFHSADEAIQKVRKNEAFGVPLSRQVAISQGFLTSSPTVWFENLPVAEVHPKNYRSIVVHERDFFDEVEAHFKDGYTLCFPEEKKKGPYRSTPPVTKKGLFSNVS